MARVSKEFKADYDLVTQTWIKRGDHTQSEIDRLTALLRIELSPGPGVPEPRQKPGGPVITGWRPLSHEQRVEAYTKAFADWAAETRRDEARSARIKAETQAWKEKVAA